MKEILLQVKDLSYSYENSMEEEKQALKHLSVAIHRQERIAVLGANGAGKSTFFLNLNGVREPDEGEIYLHGEKINKKNRNNLRKNVGIVFQDADTQIIASTVKAEIAFGPLNMKLGRDEVELRVDKAAEKLKLEEFMDRPPHYLSGGEKKRVSIADILAMESEIIIFDEPTASLDPVHVQMLEDILSELGKEGKTILLSTHDVDFAYRFAQRVLIFNNGEIIADGTAQDLFQDEEILIKANLKKPMMMQFYELLKNKALLEGSDGQSEYPRDMKELKKLLKA